MADTVESGLSYEEIQGLGQGLLEVVGYIGTDERRGVSLRSYIKKVRGRGYSFGDANDDGSLRIRSMVWPDRTQFQAFLGSVDGTRMDIQVSRMSANPEMDDYERYKVDAEFMGSDSQPSLRISWMNVSKDDPGELDESRSPFVSQWSQASEDARRIIRIEAGQLQDLAVEAAKLHNRRLLGVYRERSFAPIIPASV